MRSTNLHQSRFFFFNCQWTLIPLFPDLRHMYKWFGSLVVLVLNSSSNIVSEESPSRKRKYHPQNNLNSTESSVVSSTPHDLQLKASDFHDPQCERMYYLDKNTMMIKKNCNWGKHQKLDLELNISSNISDHEGRRSSESMLEDLRKQSSSASNMVAMGCLKCNLLVMVSKSFPSCPNCKFVNSIPMDRRESPPRKIAKSLDTLSLLH